MMELFVGRMEATPKTIPMSISITLLRVSTIGYVFSHVRPIVEELCRL